jgi:Arc/MetJ-type ribon-helix-helix transcriptional regulator
MTSPIAVRLPGHLLSQLDVLVPDRHASRSDAIRRSIDLDLREPL